MQCSGGLWDLQALRHYTHIVLDEIHERDLDMDCSVTQL